MPKVYIKDLPNNCKIFRLFKKSSEVVKDEGSSLGRKHKQQDVCLWSGQGIPDAILHQFHRFISPVSRYGQISSIGGCRNERIQTDRKLRST